MIRVLVKDAIVVNDPWRLSFWSDPSVQRRDYTLGNSVRGASYGSKSVMRSSSVLEFDSISFGLL